MSGSVDLFGTREEAVSVAVAAPLRTPLDYLCRGAAPAPGSYVLAPLSGRETLGVVWGDGSGEVAPGKLKMLGRLLDLPPMTEETRRFLERVAEYTLIPLGDAVRLATRAPGLSEPAPTKRVVAAGDRAPARLTPARARVLELVAEMGGDAPTPAALAKAAGVGSSVVAGLIAEGALAERRAPKDPPYPRLRPELTRRPLSEAQAQAAAALGEAVRRGAFAPTLLHGVTGSGKTEAYLEAVAACLRAGRQALVLLPEIALTDQFLARFQERFGARPAEWHSAAAGVERRRCWRAAADGTAQVVVGARSALFLPFKRLGLIVVDEEHDQGYKQEEGAIYHARDMAVLRAQAADAVVVLASATPSLESWVNAERGRYQKLSVPARFGKAVAPDVRTVDLRADPPEQGRWLSPSLVQAAAETLQRGEQALFFINRRGYAPLTLCRKCGHRFECPHCATWLVTHRLARKLVCHLCGRTEPEPACCPECGSTELAACGPGVERLAEEAAERFPDAPMEILSSDAAPTAEELRERINRIARGEAPLAIGTQIVAKGHNFPNLTLVGVVDADLGLHGGDFRAAERTFQLLQQVAGRAGRSEKPGRAILQTAAPDHPVMQALVANDAETFWRAEAAARRSGAAPPFGRYVAVICSGPDEPQVWEIARTLAAAAEPVREAGGEVLGPAPAPIARIRGRVRVRLLVRAPRGAALQPAIRAWDAAVKRRGSVRVAYDVDPQSFL
ncbi:MAG: primosomal protein N' [Neomegalonema sp.]|nr:primosomal protein N' [Neomegalonema sp.]